MFRRVHRVESILQFLRERAPHYGPLARDDLHKFRAEIVKASVGASISAVAGLIFACFLSIAVIVSAWDSMHRTAVAGSRSSGYRMRERPFRVRRHFSLLQLRLLATIQAFSQWRIDKSRRYCFSRVYRAQVR
jgi:hypothetical protein